MEERLYRGKDKYSGEWVLGYYCPCYFGYFPCSPAIIEKREMDAGCWRPVEVIPETVGQYIGREDVHGKKAFTGDIVKCDGGFFVIQYYAPQMMYYFHGLHGRGGKNGFIMTDFRFEIVGNIHDNPELMEEARK